MGFTGGFLYGPNPDRPAAFVVLKNVRLAVDHAAVQLAPACDTPDTGSAMLGHRFAQEGVQGRILGFIHPGALSDMPATTEFAFIGAGNPLASYNGVDSGFLIRKPLLFRHLTPNATR